MKLRFQDSDRHKTTAAGLLACAVCDLFPKWDVLACGSTDLGFYCELCPNQPTKELLTPLLEERMHSLVRQGLELRKAEMLASNAADLFRHQHQFLLADRALNADAQVVNVLFCGEQAWLLDGDCLENADELAAFTLTDCEIYEEGGRLRIEGLVADNKQSLKKLVKRLQRARRVDHRLLGTQQELFTSDEFDQVFWKPKGTTVRRLLRDAWEKHVENSGYQLVCGPGANFAPYYGSDPRHYGELPLSFAQISEMSCEEVNLHGLLRSPEQSRDIGIVFCRKEQLEEQLARGLQSIQGWLTIFDIDSRILLRTRPKAGAKWQEATEALRTAVSQEVDEVDAGRDARGPSLVWTVEDAAGRTWQTARLEVDLTSSRELELRYQSADEKLLAPHIVELSWMGGLERWIGLLLECKEGWLPLSWAPEQLRIFPMRTELWEEALKLADELRSHGIRAKVDRSGEKLALRVKDALLAQVPYTLVLGRREQNKEEVLLRDCRSGTEKTLKREQLLAELKRDCD